MINKLIAGLLVTLALICLPLTSSSKGNEPKTITLTSSNLLVLNGVVNGETVGPLITKAKQLDDALGRNKHIYLYINSPGGEVQTGMELIEALKGMGHSVDTVTAFGAPSQLDSRVRLWTEITKEMDETTVRRTNNRQTLESYQKAYSQELWVTGQEAVAGGYADAVVRVKCDKTLNGTTQHEVEFMGMTIDYELSNCPLNTSPANIRIGGKALSQEYTEIVKKLFLSNYSMEQNTPLPMVF